MARDSMQSPPGNLAVIAIEEAMSTAVHPAPMTRSAQQNSGPLMRRLREVAQARTAHLAPRQRVLVTHLAVVTLMSVAAPISVLAR